MKRWGGGQDKGNWQGPGDTHKTRKSGRQRVPRAEGPAPSDAEQGPVRPTWEKQLRPSSQGVTVTSGTEASVEECARRSDCTRPNPEKKVSGKQQVCHTLRGLQMRRRDRSQESWRGTSHITKKELFSFLRTAGSRGHFNPSAEGQELEDRDEAPRRGGDPGGCAGQKALRTQQRKGPTNVRETSGRKEKTSPQDLDLHDQECVTLGAQGQDSDGNSSRTDVRPTRPS